MPIMAKAKKAVGKTATPVATSDKKAAKRAADCSCVSTVKNISTKAVEKPALETKTVCFTDKETGKRFCGEVTEVVKEKTASKVGAMPRRRRRR